MNRRHFLTLAASATLASCAAQPTARVATAPVPLRRRPSDIAEGIDATWLSSGFFVVRHAGRLYAMSATCTHRECDLEADNRTSLTCPCHGSHFDATGHVLNGPAKRSLPRLAISLDETGQVVVDPRREFTELQWNDAGASLAVAG